MINDSLTKQKLNPFRILGNILVDLETRLGKLFKFQKGASLWVWRACETICGSVDRSWAH